MSKYQMYTDGGARGNPGPQAIGIVIYNDNGQLIKQLGEYVGSGTNNQAEYLALIRGLTELANLNAKTVICYLDSELIVRQLNGQYKIKESGLQDLAKQVFKLTNQFTQVNFVHIPREKNKLADKLVNEALDKQQKIT